LHQWLTDVHGTYAGPGWELIEVDDTTLREVPSGGTTVDDLTAGNLWNPAAGGDPPVGSWAVIQSKPGAISPNNTFQMLLYISGDTSAFVCMMPLSDFVTGGGETEGGLPTVPTIISSYTNMTKAWDQQMTHFATADQSVLQMGIVNMGSTTSSSNRWLYIGELDVPAVVGGSGVNVHKYPFVLRINDAGSPTSTFTTSDFRFWPADADIEFGGFGETNLFGMRANSTDQLDIGTGDTSFQTMEGPLSLMPYGLFIKSAVGHIGYLRHVFIVDGTMAPSFRFTDGKDYMLLNSGANPALAIRWDSLTGL